MITTETKPAVVKPADLLTSSRAVWNNHDNLDVIPLHGERNVLTTYDYEPQVLRIGEVNTDFKILTTSDEHLPVGVPYKDTYQVLDNGAFITVIESICQVLEGMGIKWTIATTGTLRNRGRVFIALALDGLDEFKVRDRVFNAFLNCLNSVDKSCSVTFSNNTFCVCCSNTFSAALKPTADVPFQAKIKHTKGMQVALEDIPLLVEAWISGNEKIFAKLKAFHSFGMTLAEAENTFAAFLSGQRPDTLLKTRSLNIVDKLKGLFSRGAGNNGETALDVFSAVTDYYSHESAGKTDDPFRQMESSEIGDGQNKKESFFELLSEMTDKTEAFQGVCKIGEHVLIASLKAKADSKA